MATYGIDQYGRATYGSSGGSDQSGGSVSVANPLYLVSSIAGYQNGVGSARIEVGPPTDPSITRFRLVRNRYGHPSDEEDGDVLFDSMDVPTVDWGYTDSDLEGGRFYYYGFFILVPDDGGTWYRSGSVEILVVADYAYPDYLYALIPRVYKAPMNELTDPGVDFENTPLRKFIDLFGFGFDTVRTDYDVVSKSNDASAVSIESVIALAEELGLNPEPTLTAYLNRQRVRTASYVYRQRGTDLGLRNAINAATGWDADIEIGPNEMLNGDQARFRSPSFPDWKIDVDYAAGSLVKSGTALYVSTARNIGHLPASYPSDWTAISAQTASLYVGEWDANTVYSQPEIVSSSGVFYAYTNATPSQGNLVSNPTYWSVATPTVLAYGNKKTAGYSTWEQQVQPGVGGLSATKKAVYVQVGASDPDDSNPVNSRLIVKNDSASTGHIGVRHISRDSSRTSGALLRGEVVDGGVPFNEPPVWKSNGVYQIGDRVTFESLQYVALAPSINQPPTGYGANNAYWAFASSPDFNRFTASAYSIALDTAANFRTTIEWYDEYGNLLGTTGTPGLGDWFEHFDYMPWPKLKNNSYWAGPGSYENGTLPEWYTDEGVAYTDPAWTPASGDYTVIVATPGSFNSYTDGEVGLTFRSAPVAGREHGIAFRWDALNLGNGWFASRTRLLKVVSGAVTQMATWTAIADNQRMTVQFNGNAIKVFKYNPITDSAKAWDKVQIASITDSYNATKKNHGLFERKT